MKKLYNPNRKIFKLSMKLFMLFLVVTTLGGKNLYAQDSRTLSFAILNEGITFPFTSYKEFHPGLELGMSIKQKAKAKSIQTWSAYGGWYYHAYVQNAFYVRGEYLYDIKLPSKLSFGVLGGLGYLHTFYPGPVYEMDSNTGEFSETRQLGKPRGLITTGVQLSWRNEDGLSPFVRQEFSIESPFANGILLMPHSFLKLGFTKNI